jgi:hypothetical protein
VQLQRLGRVHDPEQACTAVACAREHFQNFNCDLMYALPEQTLAQAQADVEALLAIAGSHVSLYQLTLEPNTVFAKYPPKLPDEDTAAEIIADFPDGVDYLITGVGTGGHITGVGEVLKERFPNTKVFAVEPEKSPVISGGAPSPHRLQGIGAGFVPSNLHLDVLDGVIPVSEEAAFEYAQRAAREEGIFMGVSSGASLAAVAKKLPEIPAGSTVLTFCYDTGERYLSVEGLF